MNGLQHSQSTMSTTATTLLPRGVYRLVVAGGAFESQVLTAGESHVTVLPPSVGNDPKQEVIHIFMTSSIVAHLPFYIVVNCT